MSLDAGRYKLNTAWKTLMLRWEETRLTWHDVVRAEFAEEFWDGMERPMLSTLSAIDRLTQALGAMKHECE